MLVCIAFALLTYLISVICQNQHDEEDADDGGNSILAGSLDMMVEPWMLLVILLNGAAFFEDNSMDAALVNGSDVAIVGDIGGVVFPVEAGPGYDEDDFIDLGLDN